MNAARFFMRREDYQPPQTPADSPFRRFTVSCVKCGSFKLQVIGEFDSDAGELKVFLFCPSCREREQVLRSATIKTVPAVSGFFPAVPGRDFPGRQASHRRAMRRVVPPAG